MKTPQSDVEQLGFTSENRPLFVYSYSSKGFPDLNYWLKHSLPHVPSYLLSLYDYEHIIPSELISTTDPRIRIWDSGGYETMFDSTCKSSMRKKWDENIYVQTANRIPKNGLDVLVNYDKPCEPSCIQRQIEKALDLFTKVKGVYTRDLLIHVPDNIDPYIFAETLSPYANEFQIIGLTEKEIAPTWAHGVYFINRLRLALSALDTKRYIPIHIFGCFDLKTVARYTLAGADIFDGLTWLRYLFLRGNVLYQREIEYAIPIEQLLTTDLELSMILHNIRDMEQLRSDLTYAIYTNDIEKFREEMSDINKVLDYFNEQGVN